MVIQTVPNINICIMIRYYVIRILSILWEKELFGVPYKGVLKTERGFEFHILFIICVNILMNSWIYNYKSFWIKIKNCYFKLADTYTVSPSSLFPHNPKNPNIYCICVGNIFKSGSKFYNDRKGKWRLYHKKEQTCL